MDTLIFFLKYGLDAFIPYIVIAVSVLVPFYIFLASISFFILLELKKRREDETAAIIVKITEKMKARKK